ncbi:MAG: AlpA family transcriptional regulator [Steroidobacteraceae bacterium]|nr:AlpA family transcriptional regulator [Steroidobacteraceae bacterium]
MPVDMLDRVRTDPGHRTLGELLQERQWALQEIERLRARVVAPPDRRHVVEPVAVSERPRVPKPAAAPLEAPAVSPHQLLRLPAVQKMIGLSRSTIYQMIERGRFPPGVRLGARARGWRMGDVVAWSERLSS